MGAGIGAGFSYIGSLLLTANMPDPSITSYHFATGVISNIFLTSTITWTTGKILKQKGHWWRTAIGGGIGSILGYTLATWGNENEVQSLTFSLLMPSLGAVIGLNF